jgi:hypothetical protein
LLIASSHARAHGVFPRELEICGFDTDSTATFDVDDGGSCSALITVQSLDPMVATVTPGAISAVRTTFTVEANGVGMTSIRVAWTGEGPNCNDIGSDMVTVTVRDRAHPICRGDGELGFAFVPFEGSSTGQYIVTTNQRGANVVMTHSSRECDCSRVIITQMINDGMWRIDVDPSQSGADTPFYNYDPVTMMRIPDDELGGPGDCSGNDATLQDNPLQLNDPVVWEACAICCDDGRILDCRKWSYNPDLESPVRIDGETKLGRYVDDGRIPDFSADARQAYREGIAAYLERQPTAASDPCLSNFIETLGEPPNEMMPAPPGTSVSSAKGGCAVSPGPFSHWTWLLAFIVLRRLRSRGRPLRSGETRFT